ncbi:MAG: alpha/beta hydrolase, partial [Erysipelotrichaceae bacterium]|nr:alpha/beta hydrolase [Erysipelotrichaceae bacterium]
MKKRNRIQLLAALVLCAISIISAGLLQTDFGRVTMTDITLETEAGNLTAYLFKPKSATAENPAPAVLCSHGYLNNREMQDCNYIELARRGYVVISLDDFSHGNSDVPKGHEDSPIVKSNGLIAFIEYLDSLDYVDSTKIGVTGHSMGGSYTIVTMTYYSDLEREALKKGTDPTEAHKLNKINTGVIVGNYPTRMAQKTNGETFL